MTASLDYKPKLQFTFFVASFYMYCWEIIIVMCNLRDVCRNIYKTIAYDRKLRVGD